MTTVIALKTNGSFFVGSDSYCGDDDVSLSCGPKFLKSNGVIWGLCGYTIYENELKRAIEKVSDQQNPPFKTAISVIKEFRRSLEKKSLLIEKDGFKEMKTSNFFFIADDSMYYVEEDLSYWETTDEFMVIGCGKQYALGSLATTFPEPDLAGKRVEMALRAAARFSPFVREPFHIKEFEY